MVLFSHHSSLTVLTGELTELLPHCPQVVCLALYLEMCEYYIEVKAISSWGGKHALLCVQAHALLPNWVYAVKGRCKRTSCDWFLPLTRSTTATVLFPRDKGM